MQIIPTILAKTVTSSSITTVQNTNDAAIWAIIAIILAIVGGILTYFLFVKSKKDVKSKKAKNLKEFLDFKTLLIEPTLKITYYIATIYCILMSFALISFSFLAFIGTLILGPIIIRLIYEASMMFVMIWRNTRDIADKNK